MQRVVEYDVVLMQRDMAAKGWSSVDLAIRIRKNKSTVSRFFSGEVQTSRTAKAIAKGLGQQLHRYILKRLEVAS